METSPEQVYSRIARICKDDTGDTSVFSDKKFLTFSKVQLQCSYSQQGQAPYQFDRVSKYTTKVRTEKHAQFATFKKYKK